MVDPNPLAAGEIAGRMRVIGDAVRSGLAEDEPNGDVLLLTDRIVEPADSPPKSASVAEEVGRSPAAAVAAVLLEAERPARDTTDAIAREEVRKWLAREGRGLVREAVAELLQKEEVPADSDRD